METGSRGFIWFLKNELWNLLPLRASFKGSLDLRHRRIVDRSCPSVAGVWVTLEGGCSHAGQCGCLLSCPRSHVSLEFAMYDGFSWNDWRD